MDQHPIPQDVTGFQFKLVGSMTVKQFGYVAAGVISAVVLYYMPFPGPTAFAILVKLFLIPFLGSSGFIIAFVPVEGRPIDTMTMNFVKAIFSPNQYVYRKTGRKFSFSTIELVKPAVAAATGTQTTQPHYAQTDKSQQLQALLMHSSQKTLSPLDQRESAFLKTLAAIPGGSPTASSATPSAPAQPAHAPTTAPSAAKQPATPAPQPQATPVAKPTAQSLEKEEAILAQQLFTAKQAEATTHTPAETESAHTKVQTLEKQVEEIHRQKQQLEQELMHLKNQLPAAQATPPQKSAAPEPTPQATAQPDPAHVRAIPQNVIKKAGLPHVPDTANVVVGIVKDPRGNVLPNILVEVKDKEGNPVRAFKTNPLGQFASATPLSAGIYTIELEDPKKQHNFDVIQIAANNQIMLPIEIISHDAREELRKQLFAN